MQKGLKKAGEFVSYEISLLILSAILSLVVSLIFCIIDFSFHGFGELYLIATIVIFVLANIYFAKSKMGEKKEEMKNKKINEEKKKSRIAYKEKMEKESTEKFDSKRQDEVNNLGKDPPRKVVRCFRSDITLYEEGIRIKDKEFETKDIIGSQITDPKGEWAEELGLNGEEITTSTKSAVGRAIVGGLIAGPAGAIVGGATAKKNVKRISYGHNYVVKIFTLNNRYSVVDVEIGEDYSKAVELKALIDAVVARNKK